MTAKQMESLRALLLQRGRPETWHNGACIGADEEASMIIVSLWGDDVYQHAYPSTIEDLKSKKCLELADEVEKPQPPLKRNHDIVDMVDLLIACPQTQEEQQRSGTWTTVRYARRKKVEVIVITPDGYWIGDDND